MKITLFLSALIVVAGCDEVQPNDMTTYSAPSGSSYTQFSAPAQRNIPDVPPMMRAPTEDVVHGSVSTN